ncbi:unnamed protein product [Effrenium voratum]|uniref:Uncharacterized protein n=1 Tax=Effrenium voratum TaxID=2562239 RepID=A0AA36NMJ1_9DINO|nr:unnamed protein product [Effrenium voratum]
MPARAVLGACFRSGPALFQVQILVQGPILASRLRTGSTAAQHTRSLQEAQLHGDTVHQPPKFIIPTNDGEDGVEVKAKPWHEVQVQYALTDLGRPDGSTGGFYGLMRRTRFIKLEVLRRLFAEDGDAYRPGVEGDFRDETLSQPLTNALAQLVCNIFGARLWELWLFGMLD